ncbi:unnamed protein product [Peniophora sp. CBMAI 1063]|nr:unnamed protein product [Peniophora sp. CBMAI 1063]
MNTLNSYSNFNAGHPHDASGIGDGQYEDDNYEELLVNMRNTGHAMAAEAGPVIVPDFNAFNNGVPNMYVATPFEIANWQAAAPTPVAPTTLRLPSPSSSVIINNYLRTHPLGGPMNPQLFGTYSAPNTSDYDVRGFSNNPNIFPPCELQHVTLSGPGESFADEAAAYPPAVPTAVAPSRPPPMASLMDHPNVLALGGAYGVPLNTGGNDIPVFPNGFNTFAPSDTQPLPMPALNMTFANEIVAPQPAIPSVVAPSLPSTLIGYPFPLGGSMFPQPFSTYSVPPNTSGHNALFNADALYNLPPPDFHPGAAQEQGAFFPLQAAKAHANRFQSAPRHTHHHSSVNARHAPYNTEMPQANAASVDLSANNLTSTRATRRGGARAGNTRRAKESLLKAQLAEHRLAIRSDPTNWEVADDVPESVLVCEFRGCTADRELWEGRYPKWEWSEGQRYISHVDTHRPKGHKLFTHPCDACDKVYTRQDALHRHYVTRHAGPREGGAGAGSGNAQAGPSRLTAS